MIAPGSSVGFLSLSSSKHKRNMRFCLCDFLLPSLSVSCSKCPFCLFRFLGVFISGGERWDKAIFQLALPIYIQRADSRSLLWQTYTHFIKILIYKYWLWELLCTKLQPVCARGWLTSSCMAVVTQKSGTPVSFYSFHLTQWVFFPSLVLQKWGVLGHHKTTFGSVRLRNDSLLLIETNRMLHLHVHLCGWTNRQNKWLQTISALCALLGAHLGLAFRKMLLSHLGVTKEISSSAVLLCSFSCICSPQQWSMFTAFSVW